MSGSVAYYDGTTIRTNTPGTTGQVLVSQGTSPPVFQNAPALFNSFSAVYTADQTNITGNSVLFNLVPDTVQVTTGFTYNGTTGGITVNNTGVYKILANLLLTGINNTHNLAQWQVVQTGVGQIAETEPGNLFAFCDNNTQFTTVFNTVLSLTALDEITISFTAYFGTQTISTTNSNLNTNFITIQQIG